MASEFLIVAQQLLSTSDQAMTASELVDAALNQGLFSDRIAGKTLNQTMKSKLSVDIRRNGIRSAFVRVRPGYFRLRDSVLDPEQIYEAKPFRKPRSEERVLVVPTKVASEVIKFHGIQTRTAHLVRKLLHPSTCEYLERFKAEQSDRYRQVLTYVLVTRGEDVLCFKRGNYNRVEDFLKGQLCIGFGGHVTDEDLSLLARGDMGVVDSARRELLEELLLPSVDRKRVVGGDSLRLVGVLNDESSAVGRRHIAFVLRYEVSEDADWDKPAKGEKSIAQLHWIRVRDGVPKISRFEYWSQLCLRTFFPKLARESPDFHIVAKKKIHSSKVVVLVGALGSGKSDAAQLLRDQYGYRVINTGQVLAKLLGRPKITERSRASFQEDAHKFIQGKGGPQRFARAIAAHVRGRPSQRYVIDGVRQLTTYRALLKLLGNENMSLIFVQTSPDVAYRFYCERGQASFAEFLKLRQAPVEREVPSFLKVADAVVYNWWGKQSYERTIHRLMSEVLSGR